ncbi:MAG: hypothetical protein IJ550_02230 [Bacteroidaceae bacterium]|nr:hypothetical protein [Bacteroidaceae bacterium]
MEPKKNKLELSKEQFESALEKELASIKDKIKMTRLGANGPLKQTPLLKLYDEGKLEKVFIVLEMPKIQNKTSTLPRAQRDVVSAIISKSIWRAADEKRKAEETKEQETESEKEVSV